MYDDGDDDDDDDDDDDGAKGNDYFNSCKEVFSFEKNPSLFPPPPSLPLQLCDCAITYI